MAPVPTLLSRAGFTVDLISDERMMTRCRNVNKFIRARNADAVIALVNQSAQSDYDLIVPCDDASLRQILNARLPDGEKATLLPVVARENWAHIGSKINLSKILTAHGVKTPAFHVAQDSRELERIVLEFGCPVFVKNDCSGGGQGVFSCETPEAIARYAEKIVYPALVQEWIDGQLLDLSGFFQKGELVFFAYAEILEARPNAYGPSVFRKYFDVKDVEAACVDGVARLGKALGAHGFVNIGALRAERDGQLYFIEADMRPIAWIEYPKFIGDDPARRIADYFQNSTTMSAADHGERQSAAAETRALVLPFMGRMEADEIAANKYDCQKYRVDYFRPQHWALRQFWLKPLAEFLLTLGRVGSAPRLSAAGLVLWHLMPRAGE